VWTGRVGLACLPVCLSAQQVLGLESCAAQRLLASLTSQCSLMRLLPLGWSGSFVRCKSTDPARCSTSPRRKSTRRRLDITLRPPRHFVWQHGLSRCTTCPSLRAETRRGRCWRAFDAPGGLTAWRFTPFPWAQTRSCQRSGSLWTTVPLLSTWDILARLV
jgi:hypothetical protein